MRQRTHRLTQAIVREFVRTLGGTFKRDAYGDLVVRFGEETYHTTDLEDALGTARCMKGSHPRIDDAEQFLRDMEVK